MEDVLRKTKNRISDLVATAVVGVFNVATRSKAVEKPLGDCRAEFKSPSNLPDAQGFPCFFEQTQNEKALLERLIVRHKAFR